MNDVAITIKNASVIYRKRRSLFRHDYFDALKDINLEVLKGETLGIIGRNGCGKSTLLKLLAGIFTPDLGGVNMHGNKASLLTLAAGFDPNLSGRDNAILSAMMLGHSYKSALVNLDSIRDYSEIGRFFVEPVKTYSSGMRARLGFAVAIMMKADVLLIDEVLGVGDSKFQHKAEETMHETMKSNQTVVLVSHSADQIRRTCDRAVWIESGQICAAGNTEDVITKYEKYLNSI